MLQWRCLERLCQACDVCAWRHAELPTLSAGLGWLGVGVMGDALLRVWAHKGVAVTTREALLPDYAREFERPGFSTRGRKLPKAAARTGRRATAGV